MGQTYDVNLRVRFIDEKGAKRVLMDKVARGNSEHVLYGMQGLRMKGFDFDEIWDLMSVFFCGWGDRLKPSADGEWLWAGFDASYGWEGVMIDAFNLLAPYLEDGSEIKIYPDIGLDHGVVKDGNVKWIS